MTVRWKLAVAAVSMAVAATTPAATYHVALGGSDTAAGSAASPWATLQKAANSIAAGDTVIVHAGNYAGFNLTTSGTATDRITFSAEAGAVINQRNPVTPDGINLENVSHVTVEGFTLLGSNNPATTRAGIRVVGNGSTTGGAFSTGVIVRNNHADQWGKWGIFTGFAQDIVIENNETSRSAEQHGIYFSNSGDNPIIRGNHTWGNAAAGIHLNGDINSGNTSLARVDGVISGALIEGNVVHDNGVSGAAGINADGVKDSRIQNNLLYNNRASGIALFEGDASEGSSNNVIANNTVVMASGAGRNVIIIDESPGNTLLNNILFTNRAGRGAINISTTDDSLDGFVSDFNLVANAFGYDDTGTATTLASWQATTGQDLHSRTLTLAEMEALFIDFDANLFDLAEGSLAIDSGTSGLDNGIFRFAPAIDLRERVRPQNGMWDIGAFEPTLPEPSFAGLIGLAMCGLLRRRRCRQSAFPVD